MIISFFHSFLELRQYTFFVNNGKIVKFLWKCFLQWKLQNNVLKCVHICVVCFIQLRFCFEILISEKIIASLENPFSLVNQFFFSFVLTIPVFICHENILMFDFYLLYFKIILQLIWRQYHLRNQKIVALAGLKGIITWNRIFSTSILRLRFSVSSFFTVYLQ